MSSYKYFVALGGVVILMILLISYNSVLSSLMMDMARYEITAPCIRLHSKPLCIPGEQ